MGGGSIPEGCLLIVDDFNVDQHTTRCGALLLDDPENRPDEVWCFLIAERSADPWASNDIDDDGLGHQHCLALLPTRGIEAEYVRVGKVWVRTGDGWFDDCEKSTITIL